jgi:hypothetical protein
MSRPPSVTQAEFSAVADRIQELGLTPSARNVREILKKGNNNTLQSLLLDWQCGCVKPKPVIADILEPSIAHLINSYIAEKIEEATTDYILQLADKDSETQTRLSEYKELKDDHETLTEALSSLQTERDELNGRFQQLALDAKNAANELQNERQVSENAKVALGQAELQLKAITEKDALIEHLRDELSKANEKATRAEARLEAELEHRK